MSFGEENVGEFTIANISYFGKPALAAGVKYWHPFCQIRHQSFFHQNFALYSIYLLNICTAMHAYTYDCMHGYAINAQCKHVHA